MRRRIKFLIREESEKEERNETNKVWVLKLERVSFKPKEALLARSESYWIKNPIFKVLKKWEKDGRGISPFTKSESLQIK